MARLRLFWLMVASWIVSLHLAYAGDSPSAQPRVRTVPSIELEVGARGVLPCEVRDRPYAVYWNKGLPSSPSRVILAIDMYYSVGTKSGPGYDSGSFDVTTNYSLVIEDVVVGDEGQYICEVSDFETVMLFRNYTDVTVFATPKAPFPTIGEQCPSQALDSGQGKADDISASSTSDGDAGMTDIDDDDVNNDTRKKTKTISRKADTESANLTCFVMGYFPNISLSFRHGLRTVDPLLTSEWTNPADGTLTICVTIAAPPSEVPYECIASDIPGVAGERTERRWIDGGGHHKYTTESGNPHGHGDSSLDLNDLGVTNTPHTPPPHSISSLDNFSARFAAVMHDDDGATLPSWVIGLICAIIVIALVFLLICVFRSQRGDSYYVADEEKHLGEDTEASPLKDDEHFQEYFPTSDGAALMAYTPSLPSLASRDAGSSDRDSMDDYADGEAGWFSEEGSFIGQYGDGRLASKNRERGDDGEHVVQGRKYSEFI